MAAAEQTVLILGGTSDIARATALAFAQNRWAVRLAGRALSELQREADDIWFAWVGRSLLTSLTRLTQVHLPNSSTHCPTFRTSSFRLLACFEQAAPKLTLIMPGKSCAQTTRARH